MGAMQDSLDLANNEEFWHFKVQNKHLRKSNKKWYLLEQL